MASFVYTIASLRKRARSTIPILVSMHVAKKLLAKHKVERKQVEECFANRCGAELSDNREQHASDPPTRWFIARTHHCRLLKVVYVPRGGGVHIRTAHDPNEKELSIYRRFGGEID